MARISKRFKAMSGAVEPGKQYPVDAALKILKDNAKTKLKDMNAANVDAAIRTLAGSARSMGITVEG